MLNMSCVFVAYQNVLLMASESLTAFTAFFAFRNEKKPELE